MSGLDLGKLPEPTERDIEDVNYYANGWPLAFAVAREHARREFGGSSVLQDWVTRLPLREQGTLLTVVRGCDLAPKMPFESTERQLVGFARFCFLNPADVREVGIPGSFFQPEPPAETWRASELGHYPQHWYSHLMHAYEIIGYRHPNDPIRARAFGIYWKLAHSLHLKIETFGEMEIRLSEDRIISGTVVS